VIRQCEFFLYRDDDREAAPLPPALPADLRLDSRATARDLQLVRG
jgi:hypothetical protein